MLFDLRERTDQITKNHGETDWEYLERSGRPEAQRVRDLVTSWLSGFPEEHRGEIVSRMRGGDDTEFQAAAFELLVYSALRWLGCQVEVHPALPTGTRRPDFLAIPPAGSPVYVEAVLASEFTQEAKAARRRTKVVLDAIERVDSPDFFIAVDADGDPERPPSGKRLRAALQQWISGLDYEAVAADLRARGNDALPKFTWNHEGWEISFDAIPKKPDRRGQGQRTIGAIFGEARWGTAHETIREAVKFKDGRYGDLPHPLLVAVNVDAMSVDREDEMNALFGDEQYVVRMGDRNAEPHMRRAPNGAWMGAAGPQYTRVSGAWVFRGASPWNVASRSHTVYFNPHAARPLPPLLDLFPHAKGTGGIMRWSEGLALCDVFGLSVEWPETI